MMRLTQRQRRVQQKEQQVEKRMQLLLRVLGLGLKVDPFRNRASSWASRAGINPNRKAERGEEEHAFQGAGGGSVAQYSHPRVSNFQRS